MGEGVSTMSDTIDIRHEGGTRFTATSRGLTIVSGKGASEEGGEDGMSPGEVFAASLGMCVGVTLLKYCGSHGMTCRGLTIEMERVSADDGSRMKAVALKVCMPFPLSEKEVQVLHRVAHKCYVHQSIQNGVEMDVSISGGQPCG